MEAIGLASSIVAFIDVAFKIVRGTHEVYTSVNGATQINDHTGVVVGDLQRVTAELRSHPQSSNDLDLVELASKCQELSDELLQLLHKFLPKTPGKWQSFVATCRILRKQKEAASMEARLDRYRQQISERLLWLLFKQQSPIKKTLDTMLYHANTLHNSNARKMEDVEYRLSQTLQYLEHFDLAKKKSDHDRQQIQELLTQTNDRLDDLQIYMGPPDVGTSQLSRSLEDLVSQAQHLYALVQAMPSQNQILRRLFYRSIFRREDEVIDATGDTFKWVFETASEQPRLVSHLTLHSDSIACDEPLEESEETLRMKTSRIFMDFLRYPGSTLLIEGKAGCGKSTFMKYVAHKELTDSSLKAWAGTKKLVAIKVFFWQSDDPLQESIEGFFRSILFQVLSQCPELTGDVFPHQSADEIDAVEYRLSELQDAFERLLSLRTEDTYCFFCFIDGLDEHQGDNLSHENLASQLVSWASLNNVKIMCSARPYTVFIETFREAGDVVEFHKLTRSDITNFAEVKFTMSLSKPKLLEAQRNCLGLVQDITENAQGIFLWASMVVRTLINQVLDRDDSEKALRRRLQECIERDSLDSLFELILQRVEKAPYVQMRSNMVLYLAAHNPFESPLNALIFSWLDELEWFLGSPDANAPLDDDQEDYSEESISPRIQRVTSLIHQLTQGLLEVVDTHDPAPYFRYRVDLYHRSVRDFLTQRWKTGVRPSPFSSPELEAQAYCRLRSLEAKCRTRRRFIHADQISGLGEDADASVTNNLRSLFEYTFVWLGSCSRKNDPPPKECLRDFEKALLQSQDSFPPFLLGRMLINDEVSWRYHSRNALDSTSFLHWAAYWAQGEFVKARLSSITSHRSRNPASLSELNLLLSSSFAADVETTRYLLSNGHRPDESLKIFDLQVGPDRERQNQEAHIEEWSGAPPTWESIHQSMGHQSSGLDYNTTVWMVFLRDFASNVKLYCWKRRVASSWPLHLDREWLERLSKITEAYLEAGADPSVYFLLFHHSPRNMYKATLYQMLDVFKPENLASFDDLLRKSWWKDILFGKGLISNPTTYQPVTTDLLLGGDWKVLGVGLDNGQELMGSFKVRVF
ncbi:hypothetical protein J7T55_003950 [Diaporthe amygdali]|uniref:uncharacterized protein n=1 Tax=Phomopsis amygdali TaxID=1214568 RepID=UPI0022FDEB94|nr:uncharacterized protein J7T55_003950 [Diaporthe amygdali]KAJ0117532.1 hypothetical protein J7T55_003950 [Diaporthe amygdali]